MLRPLFAFVAFAFVFAASHRAATDPGRPASAEELLMIEQSVQKAAADMNRWAYTEARVTRDQKGKVKEDVLIRYDPSQPYEKQWTPLMIDGKPPTEKELARYRKRGDQVRKRDENPSPKSDKRRSLGEVMDLRGAVVVSETATHVVFEVPLSKQNNDRFPPEKFQIRARMQKENGALENVTIALRESFRMKVVAKVKSGDGTLDFTTIDPKFAPALTAIKGDASASILFVNVGMEFELKRTDFKRVKPYAEKFGVQIGELKAIDF